MRVVGTLYLFASAPGSHDRRTILSFAKLLIYEDLAQNSAREVFSFGEAYIGV